MNSHAILSSANGLNPKKWARQSWRSVKLFRSVMHKRFVPGIVFITALWISLITLAQNKNDRRETNSPVPLVQAHAHNDYEHARPLFDALERGFCSIEADVWLVDGKLFVAHDRSQVKPERTLETLYLDPIREQVRRNGGRLYRGGPTAILLVDVKSEAEATYKVLREVLKAYGDMLTLFREGTIQTNAIT